MWNRKLKECENMFNAFLIGSNWFNNTIHRFLLWLDQTVYWAAAQCYQLFMKLATAQIFTDNFFQSFAKRIYAILGVFMLFYLVYALLNAIVEPDKLTSSDKGIGKVALNLVISLFLLGVLPSVFDMAYRLQNFILSSNLLGAVILGSDVIDVNDTAALEDNDASLIRFGDYFSFTVLNAFLNPENIPVELDDGYNWYGVENLILKKGIWTKLPEMAEAVSSGTSVNGKHVVVTYRPIISTIAGGVLVWMILSFTLDLGVRVIKFAFYQLLAPIPIILRIIPSKKGTFDKWVKQTLGVYFEVFVRVGLMFICIYFVNAITTNNSLMELWADSATGKLALAIIILGIFAFAKQAPKIISDVLGIDTGNIKLGIRDKLKAGGFFGAGAVLGAGATGLVRNGINGINNAWNNGRLSYNSFKNRDFNSMFKYAGKAFLGVGAGVGSSIAGATSGMYNAFGSAKKAGNFKDMKNAASEGAKKSWDNKVKRANYIASNNGMIGSAKAKAIDTLGAAKEWATGTPFNNFLSRIKFKEDFYKEFDEYKTLYENPEYKAMDEQLNHLKALQAQGVEKTDDGTKIDDAIKTMTAAMTNKRLSAIDKNPNAAAYIAYNMAKFAKDNYQIYKSEDVDFDFNGANINDFVLKGNKVYHQNGDEWTANELKKIYEDTEVNVDKEFKSNKGMKSQIGASKAALKSAKQTPIYKEAAKKEAAKK